MDALSLAQVRESLDFAWHPLGYLFVCGELFRAVPMEPPAGQGYQGALSVRRAAVQDGDKIVDDGWLQVEGSHDPCRAKRESAVRLQSARPPSCL